MLGILWREPGRGDLYSFLAAETTVQVSYVCIKIVIEFSHGMIQLATSKPMVYYLLKED